MKTRERNAIALAAVGVAAIASAFVAGGPERRARALDAVPEGSWLVITIDGRALRESGTLEQLGLTRPTGLDQVRDACGFDPLERATEIVIAAPEEGRAGEFGVAAALDEPPERLAECARAVIAARGASASVHVEAGYTVVEDATRPEAHPRIAMKRGAPLLVGQGAWLRQMMRAADGTVARSAIDRGTHAELRRVLGDGAIVATASLPANLRAKLRDEVAEGDKPAGPTFRAVLGVSAVGVRVRLGHDAGPFGALAIATSEGDEGCRTLAAFVEKRRSALAAEPAVRLVGLGRVLDATTTRCESRTLRVEVAAPADDLAAALGRAWAASEAFAPRADRPTTTAIPSAAPIPSADETLRARDR